MNNKKWLIALIVLSLSVTLNSHSFAGELERESLRGLKGVHVVVEEMHPDAERNGLTDDLIKTAVEQKLRMAGIKVLTREEKAQIPGSPYLYVRMTIFQRSEIEGIYAYTVRIQLRQDVFLKRIPTLSFPTITWERSAVGIVGVKKMKTLRFSVDERIDKFINDYLAVNSRK